MENNVPCGNTQRQKWMEKYAAYQKAFIEARDKFYESNAAMSAHPADGMPKGNARSDPVARLAERYDKAYVRYCRARAEMNTAYSKRHEAMKPLNSDQQSVLIAIYFEGKSRRDTAKELNRSDFWVRAQERTGLFLLELPSGWELDILQ